MAEREWGSAETEGADSTLSRLNFVQRRVMSGIACRRDIRLSWRCATEAFVQTAKYGKSRNRVKHGATLPKTAVYVEQPY